MTQGAYAFWHSPGYLQRRVARPSTLSKVRRSFYPVNVLPNLRRVGLCLTLALSQLAATAEDKTVWFDWFEYSGNDPEPALQSPNEFRNPILTGFFPDPSICQVGEDYYLINSSFAYFPGIPVLHSRDLVNWKQIGNVIDRPTQLRYDNLGVSRGIFAPAISHHEGVFYVVCTMVDAGGNFVMTATDPKGPWSDPIYLHFEGIDPSLYFDDDGRAWMINNGAPEGTPLYDGHRAIWIQEFDYRQKRMVGPRKVLVNGGVNIAEKPVWIEGPHIYKKDGWYYLCCAEGGTSVNHSQVIFRSRNVDGPYVPWDQNPILTQRTLDGHAPFAVTSTGHADLVVGPDGSWWAVFLAVRPYDGRYSPMGRETFLLPVDWPKDGWPKILDPNQRVPLVHKAPAGVKPLPSEQKLNGNFEWRDDFNSRELGLHWLMLRAPKQTWWTLDAANSRLGLEPRQETLSGRSNPSFLARRVQHANFSASTALEVPSDPGASAGLAVFQGEHFHYYVSAKRSGDEILIQLEKANRGSPEVLESARARGAQRLEFRIEAKEAVCRFSWRPAGGEWRVLADNQDARLLTTEVAGGFVGATVGVHARLEPREGALNVAAESGKPSTIVIVHGAWAGGWEHKRVAEMLQAKGHIVYRPTLTGQGERVHLASHMTVDLATHIEDVVNLIEWENLRDVVLVGHSYGGMVITGVADRVAERLKRVVYLDAFLPEDGESAQTALGSARPPRPAVNGFFPLGDHSGPVPRVVPQPEKTFTQPIALTRQDVARRLPTTYILTVDPGKKPVDDMFNRFHERAKSRGWKCLVMEADHVPHLSKPEELVQLLEAEL
jgi:xylan 1,4-beta-xylosidase